LATLHVRQAERDMSLPVALAVRLGNSHITRDVAALRFRKEAVGGVRNITLRLARPLDRVDQITAYTRVYVYDARSAATLAEGRLSDLGRSAGTDGQQWDLVAFGPAQHASDKTFPYMMIDTTCSLFLRSPGATRNATVGQDERVLGTPSIVAAAEEGKTIGTSWVAQMIDRLVLECGMKLGRVACTWDSGVTDANYVLQLRTRQGSGAETVAASASSNTAGGTMAAVVVTNFTNGHDTLSATVVRNTAGTTGAESHWFEFWNFVIRALMISAAGAERTAFTSTDYVLAHDVIEDLLGRVLDQYDGTNATIDKTAAYQIDQLSYPDGTTAAQVLDDLMALEPAYYWTTGPSNSAGAYSFTWAAWPTTVRYEVDLNDGGAFPVSAQELYNKVLVRWKDPGGRTRTVVRIGACPVLDNATPPVTRQAIIDASDELGSTAAATRLGDNFLAEHKYPANAGTLTASRPIRDLTAGAMIEPFEIQPGELIRVRGVESYPDALNASSNDGMTVFRIWSMEYDSDSNSAVLELDTYSRTTANALARLTTRRNRKR